MTAKKNGNNARLILSITYEQARLIDIIEAAKEVIEKASEQGSVDGSLDISNTAFVIDVEDLR